MEASQASSAALVDHDGRGPGAGSRELPVRRLNQATRHVDPEPTVLARTPPVTSSDWLGVVIDDSALFSDKLQEWEDFYNFHRPHGGLGGQTPYERLLQKAKARP